ncbi:MAG TPA: hypothetical protein VNA04_00865 [Thermoanaerobaculia bacterium]|nr:hypothetical protein [Thermoanaerobaculia bacterium]
MSVSVPSEFAGFIRETAVRAFDRLALRSKDLDPPLRSFIRSWARLPAADKQSLLDALIEAARAPEPPQHPPPGMKQAKAVRRYDPEEVAATLPKKPAVRKRPKPAAGKRPKKPQ